MDLKELLRQEDSNLSDILKDIRKFCENVWKDKLMPWFTNHDVQHSENIIELLGQMLEPIKGEASFPSKHELFILLASAYLHDVGMQYLKTEEIDINKFTEKDYNNIRKKHGALSFEIITKSVKETLGRDDFHLPEIPETYIPNIAYVSKGHSTDYFDEALEYFSTSRYSGGKAVRGDFLTTLLMMADELDLQSERVNFKETNKFDLPSDSLIHWYKHHYIDYVEVKEGEIHLSLMFPSDADLYKELMKDYIQEKLAEQIEKANPILKKNGGRLMELEVEIAFEISLDVTGVKRKLPESVFDYLSNRKAIKKNDNSQVIDAVNQTAANKLSSPTPDFTGRKKELADLGEAFERNTLISIEGIGGIRKTELALKFIESLEYKENIVWFDCQQETGFDSLIAVCGYPDLIKGENKTDLAKCSGFADLLERDRKVIFLDNYQDIKQNSSFETLFDFVYRSAKNSRIVLIAREHPSVKRARISPFPVGGLQEDALEYARKIIDNYFGNIYISDLALGNICRELEGHPLAIDLAIQLLNYGENADNIIQKVVREDKRKDELSKRLLDEVFNHPKSSEFEKKLLLNLSVFRGKFTRKAVEYISHSDSTALLHSLQDKHMVKYHHLEELFELHSLIREFCYDRLTEKIEMNKKAVEYYESERTAKFDPLLENKIFHHLLSSEQYIEVAELVSREGARFFSHGYLDMLKEMLDLMRTNRIERPEFYIYYGDIAQIKGAWDEALNYFEKASSICDNDTSKSVDAKIRYGEMLFRKGKNDEALRIFENCYDISKLLDYKSGVGRSLNDMGLVCQIFGYMDKAQKLMEEAIVTLSEIDDKILLANSINNIGVVLKDLGKTNEALVKYKESLNIRIGIGDKQGQANSINNIGSVLQDLGKTHEALVKYEESIAIYTEIGDKQGQATSINNIGLVLKSLGKIHEALVKYKESLAIQIEIGDKQGQATSINNIGSVFQDLGKTHEALVKYKESLNIRIEIGDKQGQANSINNIGSVLQASNETNEALKKYKESLAIQIEIGDKQGHANSINNIGSVLQVLGKTPEALEKFKESLAISHEIGDKFRMCSSYYNIGTLYSQKKDYINALEYIFTSISLLNQMKVKQNVPTEYIYTIRKSLGFKKFKEYADKAYALLDTNLKPYLSLEEFIKDDTHLGRNDPCLCGSGKKYKKCCGANI